MEPMINIALRAAREAARHLLRAYDRPDLIKVSEKAPNDFVTNVDREVEQIITESIRKTFPKHSFTTEENTLATPNQDATDMSLQTSEFHWVIDPIDGTTNFSRQIPHFAISIACFRQGKLTHGIVLNPVTQEEFVASRGQGAQCNGRKIRVADRDRPEGGLFASAGSYRDDAYQGHARMIEALVNARGNYREPGSAALELACLAAGRLDGVWMHNLKLWDIAAGCLLVQEAGGLIGDFAGGLNHLKTGNLVAANPKLFKSLGGLVRTHLGSALEV